MPEGDTIFRTAETLRRALAGKALTKARSSVPGVEGAALAGRRVRDVEARGKNLLVHLDGEAVLFTHMRMHGSWHLYRRGERWRKPERRARVVLETADLVAVCFSAPVIEVLAAAELDRHPMLRGLGPDLADPGCDLAEARRRLRECGDLAIGEALLRQSAVAGIGNVYKSETLFLCGASPWTRVDDLADDELDGIVKTAAGLLARNLGGWPRVTRIDRRGSRLWVYRRSGRPCARCGATIRMRRQGAAGRSTYWCPACQPERSGGRGLSPARTRA